MTTLKQAAALVSRRTLVAAAMLAAIMAAVLLVAVPHADHWEDHHPGQTAAVTRVLLEHRNGR
ncbi:hypothetical protein ACPA54_02440 [Uniformispora flossi]|uniref:hypothetical protein n=1 Tax=Uniformispora flossi TaxID=3390723 RepID=UPI003C2FBE15